MKTAAKEILSCKRGGRYSCNYWENGSFTVEAAFIISIILIILGSFILLGFRLYDKVSVRIIAARYIDEAVCGCNEPVNTSGELDMKKITEISLFSETADEENMEFLKNLAERFTEEANRARFTLSLGDITFTEENGSIQLHYWLEGENCIQESVGLPAETFVRLYRGIIWRTDENYLCQ